VAKNRGGSARRLVGAESPVDGNFNHGPGGFRFGCTGGCTALKAALSLHRGGCTATEGAYVAEVVLTSPRLQRA
jgi:hypothetical protein